MTDAERKRAAQLLESTNEASFDSERGSSESDLCRTVQGRLQCVKVGLSSMELASFMQQAGFFCQGHPDPRQTSIQCKRIAEKPLDKI